MHELYTGKNIFFLLGLGGGGEVEGVNYNFYILE